MTSPFVDRVEYQVIGRDTNASRTFRNVADAADDAGDSVTALGKDLDRVNRNIDDTANRMRQLASSMQDLSSTRQITITTNVREVLGSVEDNRKVLDLINDRFENLTVHVTATVDQLVELNDGLTTIDDNRTAIITLDDDTRRLTQTIDATVDSVVNLNDGLSTINDGRNVIINLDDDTRRLTQTIDGTVDSVVNLNDGLTTIDDNRNVITTLGDDTQRLSQDIDTTVDSVVRLNDGVRAIEDNRRAITATGEDVRALGTDIDTTREIAIRFNDEVARIDDQRPRIVDLGTAFDDLGQKVETSRTRVGNLGTDLDRLGAGNRDIHQSVDIHRSVVTTVSSDRDRLERAGLVAGGILALGTLQGFSAAFSGGIGKIPIIGPLWDAVTKAVSSLSAQSGPLGAALALAISAAFVAAAGVVVTTFGAALLAGLGGGAVAAGIAIAITDPLNRELKKELQLTGQTIMGTLRSAVQHSGFVDHLTEGLKVIRAGFRELKPELTDLFSAAGPLIRPLVDSLVGFGRAVLPGITEALRGMKPVFDELVRWMPKLGKTVGDFFANLAKNAPALAEGLGYAIGLLNTAVKIIGWIIDQFANGWGTIKVIIGLFSELGTAIKDTLTGVILTTIAPIRSFWQGLVFLGRAARGLGQFFYDAVPGVSALADALLDYGLKAKNAGKANPDFKPLAKAREYIDGLTESNEKLSKSYQDALDAANKFLGNFDAVTSTYEAIDAATQHLAKTSKEDLAQGIEASNKAGRDNREILSNIARNANIAGAQIAELGGSTEEAAKVQADARRSFMAAAAAMGIGTDKAIELADSMFGIPNADPTVTLNDRASAGIGGIGGGLNMLDKTNAVPSVGLDDNASGKIANVRAALRRLNGEHASVTVNATTPDGWNDFYGRASGGPIFGPGPKGVDSQLVMLAPGEHVLTAAEVDAAGGHQRIMEFRRSLLNKTNQRPMQNAFDVVPTGRPGGGIDAATLRRALSGMTLVIDDRTGRTAQLIARGG